MPENRMFSALDSVPPWLCGNLSLVMAETTIKAFVSMSCSVVSNL